jgi:hypothetical protein
LTRWLPLIWIAFGCSSDREETGLTVDELCKGQGPTEVRIGTGAGSQFTPLNNGDVATLEVAPQGGFGVAIRASTSGMRADDVVEIRLDTELDGALSDSFTNDVQLFCQDDGTGLLTNVVVGLDREVYKTLDDLIPLNGQEVDLVVVVTDSRGESVDGRVTVEIKVGAK